MFLSGYDAWKTRVPDEDEGPVCECCGEFLRRNWRTLGWYCEGCEELDAIEWERAAALDHWNEVEPE